MEVIAGPGGPSVDALTITVSPAVVLVAKEAETEVPVEKDTLFADCTYRIWEKSWRG
jgi:hypothetical protein